MSKASRNLAKVVLVPEALLVLGLNLALILPKVVLDLQDLGLVLAKVVLVPEALLVLVLVVLQVLDLNLALARAALVPEALLDLSPVLDN